jgi:signal transduction histidine kinase
LAVAQNFRRQRTAVTDIWLEIEGAETSERGYLLTQDASYLAPLQHAREVLPQMVERLARDRPNDPRVAVLEQALTAKLLELTRTSDLAQGGDMADALAIARTNAGSRNIAIIRRFVGEFQDELDAERIREVSRVFHDDRLMMGIDIAGLLMIALLGAHILLAVRRYLASLAAARAAAAAAYDELERSNERLDETVRVRTADLVAANDEMQRFAYIVSHDLRAPLVNIMGFTSEMERASKVVAGYLSMEDAPAELREAAVEDIPEALRFIRTSTVKMDRLINAILKLSREGRRVLAPEPIDVRNLFEGIVATMQHQADSKAAEIVLHSMPQVTSDRLALEQIFGNLIDNALKYLRPGAPGRIEVRGSREGGMVRYDIIDNGRGIAPKDYERVFELFRRAGDQSVPGEGIGLAHVRALVRRLGGTIDCNSALGEGTTFTVKLPAIASFTREIAA